ncbi:hypothetical protein [Eilatimonas milleporae]|uniref:Plastid lipid-associated protein/fibrillin conserved domain-containing protein n=1 Tax=Eilatimonas milleporae TaxID=911205 RepID=A0A3M0BZX1_9PROT|nr:hypothetical protein [Eilatimonas milleporae]RMB01927.1 hypothetical protein BXY39_3435 [Eilatimonas milleporae]
MSEVTALKTRLREAISNCRPDGTYEDAVYDEIHALIEKVVPHTPTPSPYENQGYVESPWGSEYAQFGPRHTAGKPIRHETNLALQSFSVFPKSPIKVEDIDQEIRVDGNHYNNVSQITTVDGTYPATLIVWGRYNLLPEEPMRYVVDFFSVELVPNEEGVDPDAFRAAYGLEPGSDLRRDLKRSPKLHSDVVYCDDDMRINYGSLGGIYVLRRLHSEGKSVSFA